MGFHSSTYCFQAWIQWLESLIHWLKSQWYGLPNTGLKRRSAIKRSTCFSLSTNSCILTIPGLSLSLGSSILCLASSIPLLASSILCLPGFILTFRIHSLECNSLLQYLTNSSDTLATGLLPSLSGLDAVVRFYPSGGPFRVPLG